MHEDDAGNRDDGPEQQIVSAIRAADDARLHSAVNAFIDCAKIEGQSIERALIDLKRIVLECEVGDRRSIHDTMNRAVTWCIQRFYVGSASEIRGSMVAELSHPRTTAGSLLAHAIAMLGSERIADALQIKVSALDRILDDARPMTLPQQGTLALAVLTLSEEHPKLRRRAATLLSQVRAAEAFERGETARHREPPF